MGQLLKYDPDVHLLGEDFRLKSSLLRNIPCIWWEVRSL